MSTNGKGEAGRSVRMKIEKREGSGIGWSISEGQPSIIRCFAIQLPRDLSGMAQSKAVKQGLRHARHHPCMKSRKVSANYTNQHSSTTIIDNKPSTPPVLQQTCYTNLAAWAPPSLSASRITRRLHPSPPLPLRPNAALTPAKRRLSRQRHCPYPGGDHILYRMRLCPHGNEWVACGLCGLHDLHYPWSIFCWKVQGDHPIGWI